MEQLAQVSLWLSVNGSRSSVHNDPFHNLLCIVAGAKRVTLWAPSQTAALYPLVRVAPCHAHASCFLT